MKNENQQNGAEGLEHRLSIARKLLAQMKQEIQSIEMLLAEDADVGDIDSLVVKKEIQDGEYISPASQQRIVEGVFDGQNMVGSDGKQYFVPPNYASKSKLVEGDMLKLTIQPDGTFLFKQIGPIERERTLGTLIRDELTQDFKVFADGKKYNVLQASVSYYKGDEGDQIVILIPKSAPSKWAAVENVIKAE